MSKKGPITEGFDDYAFTINEYDIPVIVHALVQRLKDVRATIAILNRAKVVDELDKWERFMLPPNMQQLPIDELREQYDPWITLETVLMDYIMMFEKRRGTKVEKTS